MLCFKSKRFSHNKSERYILHEPRPLEDNAELDSTSFEFETMRLLMSRADRHFGRVKIFGPHRVYWPKLSKTRRLCQVDFS
jgi:hypothetical protein